MAQETVLTLVTVADCELCEMTRDLVEEFMGQNTSRTVTFYSIDVDDDPEGVRAVGALSHPTLVLTVDGRERARVSGSMSKRRLLRKVLPLLYPGEQAALTALRQQLGSPAETFPTGPRRGRVGLSDKVSLLGSVPLFGGLHRRHVGQLARLVDEIHLEAGEQVTEEGQRGDEFFIVVRGGVEIRKSSRMVATLGEGECFGEMSLLDDQPRSATVTTASSTTLLVIHRDDFDRVLMSNPKIMRAMLTTLSERLR